MKDNKEVINCKIDELLDIVVRHNKGNSLGLHGGRVGMLLSYPYDSKLKKYRQILQKQIVDIFDEFDEIDYLLHSSYTYCNGVAGFGWAIEVLYQRGLLKADTNAVFEEIDEHLYTWMLIKLENNIYDFLHGAIGVGLFYLKRIQSKPELKSKVIVLINTLLAQTEVNEEGNLRWLQKADESSFIMQDCYNLGLSHGIPSILVFMVKAYNENIMKDDLKNVIRKICDFILSCQKDYKEFNFYFPTFLYKDGSFEDRSRLAWCYGDLGVCCALWHANEILKDPLLEKKIIEVLIFNSYRRDLHECGVKDAGFCHGSSGVAHIFKRFYSRYKLPELLDAANYWYNVTLNLAVHEDGLGGYKAWSGERGWQNTIGLLEGIAGIAATLQYATSDDTPWWDEIFLVS